MEENIQFSHFSVLLNECIESLNIKPDGIYIDGTAGGAGHLCAACDADGNGILPDQDSGGIFDSSGKTPQA